MSMKDYSLTVKDNRKVAEGVYEAAFYAPDMPELKGGQFIHIALSDNSRILRRPLCICDYSQGVLTVCYAVVGEGTRQLSMLKAGDVVNAMYPLGNGWSADGYKKVALLGGGLGCAVLPLVARLNPECEFCAYMGFSDASKVVLEERMKSLCPTTVATDNGTYGRKGFVTDALAADLAAVKPDAIFCCGPEVMYKSIMNNPAFNGIPVYVSLEARMGCGLGACLVCTCGIRTADGDKNLRVCADGPVFRLDEVIL